MCRSIKTLREPFTEDVTPDDVHAAALQYVRKISGFRKPAAHNAEAFDRAVAAVATATATLLDTLEVRSSPAQRQDHAHGPAADHAADQAADHARDHAHPHPRERAAAR